MHHAVLPVALAVLAAALPAHGHAAGSRGAPVAFRPYLDRSEGAFMVQVPEG